MLDICMYTGDYDIPKGTILIQNTWSIHHDPQQWKDPEAMNPERWLDENGKYVFQQNGFQVIETS